MFTRTFNPVDYNFNWTPAEDPTNHFDHGWYKWDYEAGHKAAQEARNAAARDYKARGYKVRSRSHKGQRITRGGIGSGHPEITHIVTVYSLIIED
jgi:hypothetical protein